MRKSLLASVAVSLLSLSNAYGQEAGGIVCKDIPGQTSATYRFRQLGETIEVPLRGDRATTGASDCEPVSLSLHWANGRNNGSNFNVTFLDGDKRPIFARQISGFLTGVLEFPLSSFDPLPVYGSSLEVISVPTVVRIQTVSPFAAPATLSYSITRVARAREREAIEPRDSESEVKGHDERDSVEQDRSNQGANQVVSIHDAVRLIGGSRLPLVQIELKTTHPFPVSEMPLQLQIGKRIFVDELSGDHTGRKLILSLTPEMFAELNDGDDIVALFAKPPAHETVAGEVWHFGKLRKSMRMKSEK